MYEEIDDFMIEDILAGYSSSPSPYTIYINYILSYILMLFFKIIPSINWFAISLLFFEFISFSVIGKNILKVFNKKMGIIIYLGICILFYIPLQVMLSYTSVAGILVISAMTEYIAFLIKKEKITKKSVLLILFLLINSFMLRANIIIAYFGFMLILLILLIINKNKNTKMIFITNIIYAFIIILLFSLNSYMYKTSTIYSNHTEYNKYRSILHDFVKIDPDKDSDILKKVDLNKNDIDLFYNICNSDEKVFSTNTLKTLLNQKLSKDSYFCIFDYNVLDTIKYVFSQWIFVYLPVVLTLLLLFFILIFNSKKNRITNFLIVLMVILMHMFFVSIDKSVFRVNILLYLFGILALIFINFNYILNDMLNAKKSYNILFIILLILIVAYNFCFILENRIKTRDSFKKVYEELFSYTSLNENNVYISTTKALQYRFFNFNTLTTKDKYIFSNIKCLGSWDFLDERYLNFMDKYNLDSLYLSLIKNENFYLISDNSKGRLENVESIVNFLNSHYEDKKIYYDEVKDFDNLIQIYKLYISN